MPMIFCLPEFPLLRSLPNDAGKQGLQDMSLNWNGTRMRRKMMMHPAIANQWLTNSTLSTQASDVLEGKLFRLFAPLQSMCPWK